MDIAEDYDEIARCNRCGFCQVSCPVFRSTGHEGGVARGRLALLRAIIEQRLDWSRDLESPLFNCLLCGACTANCFPAIPTADLMVRARSQYLETVGRKPIHRFLFERLLPYPRRLHRAARAVSLGKSARLPELARALGLLRLFGRDFAHTEGIIDAVPPRAFRERYPPGLYRGEGDRLDVAYFVGCGLDTVQQAAAEATLRLLRRTCRSVELLANGCCGLPAWAYGDLQAARMLVQKNLERFADSRWDRIVTDCSSCASFLKKYPGIVASGLQAASARGVADRVEDLAAFLGDRGPAAPLSPEREWIVTYHDPCHARRGQGLMEPPRRVIRAMPGVVYRELPEADWCCGGAGSYAFSNYRLSLRVLDRKMEHVRATGADVLATSCPACMIQLLYGARRHGLDIRVVHLSQLVDGKTLCPAK